ncbi:hypothetical protein MMRN_38370 [Mycobacterium marinum]|uniref:DUF7257 domain-containing protein n=1 Tax=Mycobacterium marinum TaxID=1781 RepID=UPI000CD81CD1|nr:hypothetical protein [Mycobacterium marinum]AXN50932.1 hypothetical protein CCUG20998_03530 [Mycobacterium marinum]RFZ25470.1 hypothetical protein DSM43519_01656 [Mycobacterium marinum]RFZ28357.1 hypothetical protein DSM44344_01402 [Mycobacterium marinum]WOR02983.1 hypothetical protein QDR78_17375 [Mycobacterium marinum]BBC66941.1 hypothetical protein MMRN_38370 [Mycobacterium marinum]
MTSLSDIIRVPEGLTPAGEYHLRAGLLPQMHYHSYDGGADFRMLGGFAPPWSDPRKAAVVVESLKGLIAPWQMIDQKGATQHGVTPIGSLFDPTEVTAELRFVGDDPKDRMALARLWIEANHQLKTGELAYLNHQSGRWWAPVHWFKTPPDKIMWAAQHSQKFTQVWRAPRALWQTFDSIDSLKIQFDGDIDIFDYTASPGLGAGWTVAESGDGGAYIEADGSQALAVDDLGDPTTGHDFVFRRVGSTTATDNMVVEIHLGPIRGVPLPYNSYIDIWGRMANSGTAGDDGVRLRIGMDNTFRLSYFSSGSETVLREWTSSLIPPPHTYSIYRLVCGYASGARIFKVFANGVPLQTVVESGTGSSVGSGYRSAGFGFHVGATASGYNVPIGVFRWLFGDNASSSNQSDFLKLINPGDQPMFPRYTFFGPGTFQVASAPGSSDFVQFGPLLENQIMQVRTNRELRPVVDMTSVAPTPQQLNIWQKALSDFLSFAGGGDTSAWFDQIKSIFGIVPPQGHPYSLLSGSFSAPIPAKPVGKPPVPQYIAASIIGGNADSMIIAAGTPLRRYPL